jgi:SPP1 gp7 family putative phage head morphogenesis protein
MALKSRPLAQTANARILDEIIRHSHFIEMFTTGEVRKVVSLLEKEVFSDIIRRIRLGQLSQAKVETFLLSVRGIIDSSFVSQRKAFRATLFELARKEAAFSRAGLARFLDPVNIVTTLPAPTLLRAVVTQDPMRGRTVLDWQKGLQASTKRLVESATRIGLVEGETTPQIIRRLRSTAFGTTRRQAEALTRTSIRHTTSRAREYTFENNQKVVAKVRYVATLDARTTLICMGLDGRTFLVNEGPRPPQHHQCRSDIAPVLKSWKELGIDLKEAPPGTRASMSGQVPATSTYNSWLKTQEPGFQDSVLGPARARLFRGGMHLDKFTNSSGRTLNLDQLFSQ